MAGDDDNIERVPVNFRMESALVDKVKQEAKRRGSGTTDTAIYVEAIKFYFDNKDNPAYMTPDEIDVRVEEKMNALLSDPNRLKSLKKAIFNL